MRCLRRNPSLLVALATAVGVLTAAPPALGQPEPAEESAPAAVTPPRLVRFVEAQAPAEHEGVADSVAVLLALVVDEAGRVSDAQVVESAGEAYDRAALAAAAQFEFEPARRGDTPVSVRLTYRYVFPGEPAAEEVAPQAPDPASPPPAQEPPPRSARPEPSSSAETAAPPDESAGEELSFGATAEIDAPPRETTKRVVERDKLTRIPGTGGDAVRAVEVMPGVARTSISWGTPILRGAGWHESTSFIDGVPVPLLYHFGGVKSTFNSHLLEQVELYPGNFSARFGRATGGIIDVRVRDPRTDGFHGLLELSVLDSSAVVETPVTDDMAIALGARRSNIDFFYESVVPDDAFNVVAAPLYWDYQAIGTYQINSQHRLRLMGYGSRDSLRLFFADPSAHDPALRGNFDIAMEHHRVQADLDSELSPAVQQRLQVTYGKSALQQQLGPIDAHFDQNEVFGRGEWRFTASDAVRVNVGFDVQAMFLDGQYEGGRPPQAEGDPTAGDSLSTEEMQDVDDGSLEIIRPAGYVELELRPHPRLLIVPGLRFDYYGYVGESSIDPRLSARYDVTDTTALKWGVGIYSQPPQYYEAIPDFGNPDIEPYYALHTSTGVEQQLTSYLQVGLEGFYKRLYNRVVATPGGVPPVFENDGVGRIYGGEVSAKLQTDDAFGYVAYTLSRSERQDRDEPWRLFDQDQTHILSVVASYDLGRGWEVGGRFRLVSGNPTTPIEGAVYDAGLDAYRPIHGRTNSARDPMFHQLDVRVEKEWDFRVWKLATYLDLQNAYNARNVEGTSYSYDYSETEEVTGLPIVPNLGIRGEL